jgi:hypothetical protein
LPDGRFVRINLDHPVVPGRDATKLKRQFCADSIEPGIHNHDWEYGFRACATWRIRE